MYINIHIYQPSPAPNPIHPILHATHGAATTSEFDGGMIRAFGHALLAVLRALREVNAHGTFGTEGQLPWVKMATISELKISRFRWFCEGKMVFHRTCFQCFPVHYLALGLNPGFRKETRSALHTSGGTRGSWISHHAEACCSKALGNQKENGGCVRKIIPTRWCPSSLAKLVYNSNN